MKKILIFLSILITLIYLSSAINISLPGGEVLPLIKWNEMASTLNKVDVSGGDININGKLSINGKICLDNGCLGECSSGQVWDVSTSSCITPAQTPETAGETCKTILDGGTITSGYYWIDPDGKGTGTPAIRVYCDMDYDVGGWTRYVNITGKYLYNSAKSCWLNSNGTTSYGGMAECFNPNRYSMTATTLRLRIGGQNYTTSISGGPSTTSQVYTGSAGARYCQGHTQYMTIRDRPTIDYPNVDSVWLGLSGCGSNSTPRQVGGVAGDSEFMNTSETGFGPPNAGWKSSPDLTELYIR